MRLRLKAPKTVNNVLTVLNTLLKTAVEWDVIDRMPCSIRLLKTPKPTASFHDFEGTRRWWRPRGNSTGGPYLIVLARRGGGLALRRDDGARVAGRGSRRSGSSACQRSDWKGHVTAPKGGRLRYVPLTMRLAAALQDASASARERVLHQDDAGRSRSRRRSCRTGCGGPHDARTCEPKVCMCCGTRSVRIWRCGERRRRAIQELAGHQDLDDDAAVHAPESSGDRQRDSAAGSADPRAVDRGDMLETGSTENAKSFR